MGSSPGSRAPDPRSGWQHALPGGGSEAAYRTDFSVIIGSGMKKEPSLENGALKLSSTKGKQRNYRLRKVATASREVCVG